MSRRYKQLILYTTYGGLLFLQALRPIQTERGFCSRIGRLNARVKRAQIENSLSYCVNACDLRKSERAISFK